MKKLNFHPTHALPIGILGLLSGGANADLTTWNESPFPAVIGTDATTGAGDFTWSDTAAWADGTPANGAGVIASIEPRLAGDGVIDVDASYTVGEIYARDGGGGTTTFTGSGTLIFDNGGSDSNLYMNRSGVRFSILRPSINVDLQLDSNLNIYAGIARDGGVIGILGQTISGAGALRLNLGNNDTNGSRFFRLGDAGANTYAGGTLVQHVAQTPYGASHNIQRSVQLDVLSTGAFGSGNVSFNATGANLTTIDTGRGMWIRFQSDAGIASSALVDLTSASTFAFDLNGTAQTVAGFEVDNVPLAANTYSASDFDWLFDSGTGGTLTIGDPRAFVITKITYDPDTEMITLVWPSREADTYTVFWDTDLDTDFEGFAGDITDDLGADPGDFTTFTFPNPDTDADRMFFTVKKN